MPIHRICRLVFPTVALLTVLGCGAAEEVPTETAKEYEFDIAAPNLFPMAVGNRWVYRNLDGSEWTCEVKETEEIGLHLYHIFSYLPPEEDTRFEYLKNPRYAATPHRLLLLVENEIDDATRNSIQHGDKSHLVQYKTKVVSDGDFTVIRLPLSVGLTWDAFRISLRGAHSIFGFSHSFEANWTVSGFTGHLEIVETPAGKFEGCYKIQYETKESVEFEWRPKNLAREIWEDVWNHREKPIREELEAVLSNLMPNLNLDTVWLAPGVGPVKIESAERTAVLIEYHLTEER